MEGSRVEKKEGGSKSLPWIIAGVVAAVLAGAYLGLCGWAMSRDTMAPNVSVAGVDVSDMTLEQAETTVAAALRQKGEDISLTLSYDGISAAMNGGDISIDTAQSARKAWETGRGNFLTSGFQLLSHMLGASSQVPLSIPEDEPALKDLIDDMARKVAASSDTPGYEVEGDRLVMTKGSPVLSVDWAQVRAQAEQALIDAFAERMSRETGRVDRTVRLQASEGEITEPDFDAIYAALAAEAKDAQLDPQTMEVSEEATGLDFDLEALKAAYQSAERGETFSIPVTVVEPKVTKKELEGGLFRDLLGEATSTVSGSATRRNNVKLATAACNGVILLPGEEFSYNNTTGPRSKAKGYGAAPAYVNGATVDEVGGGVCQGSSTIYYALLQTNLEIVERRAHRYAVGYVPDGMDATVSYGGIDLRFRNNTDYPVKIVTSNYDSGGAHKLNVKIYGTNPDGIYVKSTSSTLSVTAPTVQYVADEGVSRGSLVLDRKQNAYRGRTVQTYRTVYAKDGTELDRQNMGMSDYKMRPTVYHYNPADGHPSTWLNGRPPAAPGTDPGTTPPADPGTTTPEDPGTTTPEDPGTTTPEDPGPTTPVDPGPGTDPPPEPVTPEPPPSDSGVTPVDPNAAG